MRARPIKTKRRRPNASDDAFAAEMEFTADEARRLTGIPAMTMLRYFERGVLTTVIGPRGERRIRRTTLAAFMDELQIPRGTVMPQLWRVLIGDADGGVVEAIVHMLSNDGRFEAEGTTKSSRPLDRARRWRPRRVTKLRLANHCRRT